MRYASGEGARANTSLNVMNGQTMNLGPAVTRFCQPLYRFAYSLTRNELVALDLTQQTFLTLAQHAHQIRATTS